METLASAIAMMPTQSSTASSSTAPFTTSQLNFDPGKFIYIEVSSDATIYKVLTEYIAENVFPEDANSFTAEDRRSSAKITLKLGLGVFRFTWQDTPLRCLHQRRLTDSGESFSLVIFFERRETNDGHIILQGMCEDLLQKWRQPVVAKKERDSEVIVFKWRADYFRGFWDAETTILGRPLSSVILPEETEARLIKDLDEFLSEGTFEFYQQHGIPVRRSYLLHGVPGAGKTSLIQAIATKYHRHLCYLVPSEPGMTDETLRSAVLQVPDSSIIVIEDIDALFTGSRKKENPLMEGGDGWGLGSSIVNAATASRVTLSGLLNSLDGIGTASGQIVFMTTNHRENLDPALMRPGRIDVHVEFKHATKEQMNRMWCAFYPKNEDLASRFAEKVEAVLGTERIATAHLQSFFIQMRRKTGEQALECVEDIARELKERIIPADGDATESKGVLEAFLDWVHPRIYCCVEVKPAAPTKIPE